MVVTGSGEYLHFTMVFSVGKKVHMISNVNNLKFIMDFYCNYNESSISKVLVSSPLESPYKTSKQGRRLRGIRVQKEKSQLTRYISFK